MAQTATQTQNYKRSFASSVGGGMKSVFGASGRRFYELEHRTNSEKHRAGEVQKIIIDQIELGRDANCQVSFGEDCKTVSRRHAAIIKDGNGWKLVQLSKTNSTFLNGKKIETDWHLQNGDEIQLSTDGPRIGFLVREGKASLVKSINLTSRLSLFRQQALKPYKKAIAIISCVLVAVIAVGGYLLFSQGKKVIDLDKQNQELIAKTEAQRRTIEEMAKEAAKNANKWNGQIAAIKKQVENEVTIERGTVKKPNELATDNQALKACMPYVYYIKLLGYEVTLPNGTFNKYVVGSTFEINLGEQLSLKVPGYTGTGFLLNDGRFVTAHHVAIPWNCYADGSGTDALMLVFNYLIYNGYANIDAILEAVSPTGDRFEFKSSQFTYDKSISSYIKTVNDQDEATYYFNGDDYAYAKTSKSDGLAFDNEKSNNLEVGTELTVLGYPLGEGKSGDNYSPFLGNATVSQSGLYKGAINTTNTNYEHGNSGGPVFYTNEEGQLVVVGIVSSGAGRNMGIITPISAAK